jgi:hypothetical protein
LRTDDLSGVHLLAFPAFSHRIDDFGR